MSTAPCARLASQSREYVGFCLFLSVFILRRRSPKGDDRSAPRVVPPPRLLSAAPGHTYPLSNPRPLPCPPVLRPRDPATRDALLGSRCIFPEKRWFKLFARFRTAGHVQSSRRTPPPQLFLWGFRVAPGLPDLNPFAFISSPTHFLDDSSTHVALFIL